MWAKTAAHHAGLEEMDRVLQIGDMLKKELDYVRSDLSRRKNLEVCVYRFHLSLVVHLF